MLSKNTILIIDSRGLDLPYFGNLVEYDPNINIINENNLENALDVIEKYEPEIILAYDNFSSDITEICSKIRNKTTLCRAILFVFSDNQLLERKYDAIKAGADDYYNINVNTEEISLKLFAHLRRHIEELADPITKLPLANRVYKVIKRNLSLKLNEKMAVLYLDIDNYFYYKEIYGYIAAEKLIQTFIAIVKTSINENDFFGQLNENGFTIITDTEKAEKIAVFLSYSFDVVVSRFYSNEDAERGYILLSGDDKIGRRIPFVSLSMGITSVRYNSFRTYQEVINSSINIQKLAKLRTGSYWVSDRLQLSGGNIIESIQNKILIVEKDAALAYLLSITLEMQNYIVDTLNNSDEILDYIENNGINLILIDIQEEDYHKDLEICSLVKQKYPSTKVIVSTVMRNKEKILDAGVDLYVPKPYDLMTLFSWIERFLNQEINL